MGWFVNVACSRKQDNGLVARLWVCMHLCSHCQLWHPILLWFRVSRVLACFSALVMPLFLLRSTNFRVVMPVCQRDQTCSA